MLLISCAVLFVSLFERCFCFFFLSVSPLKLSICLAFFFVTFVFFGFAPFCLRSFFWRGEDMYVPHWKPGHWTWGGGGGKLPIDKKKL